MGNQERIPRQIHFHEFIVTIQKGKALPAPEPTGPDWPDASRGRHDCADFIEAEEALGIKYLVKRNPRRENALQLPDSLRSNGEPEFPRPEKTIYRGIG